MDSSVKNDSTQVSGDFNGRGERYDPALLGDEFVSVYGMKAADIATYPAKRLGRRYEVYEGKEFSLPLMNHVIRLALGKMSLSDSYDVYIDDVRKALKEENAKAVMHNSALDDKDLSSDEKDAQRKKIIDLDPFEYPSLHDVREVCTLSLYMLRDITLDQIWDAGARTDSMHIQDLARSCAEEHAYSSFMDNLPNPHEEEDFTFRKKETEILAVLVAKGALNLMYNDYLSDKEELRQQVANELVSSLNLAHKFYDPAELTEFVEFGEEGLTFQVPEEAVDILDELFEATHAGAQNLIRSPEIDYDQA